MLALLQARRHPAKDAHDIGLVDQVVATGQAKVEALNWIDSILKHPEEAILGALKILRASTALNDQNLARVEREVFSQLWGGAAHRQALSGVKAGE